MSGGEEEGETDKESSTDFDDEKDKIQQPSQQDFRPAFGQNKSFQAHKANDLDVFMNTHGIEMTFDDLDGLYEQEGNDVEKEKNRLQFILNLNDRSSFSAPAIVITPRKSEKKEKKEKKPFFKFPKKEKQKRKELKIREDIRDMLREEERERGDQRRRLHGGRVSLDRGRPSIERVSFERKEKGSKEERRPISAPPRRSIERTQTPLISVDPPASSSMLPPPQQAPFEGNQSHRLGISNQSRRSMDRRSLDRRLSTDPMKEIVEVEVLIEEVLIEEVLIEEVLIEEVLIEEGVEVEVLIEEVLIEEVLIEEVLIEEVLIEEGVLIEVMGVVEEGVLSFVLIEEVLIRVVVWVGGGVLIFLRKRE
eukprot:CAMPEP_0201502378 /NCGR_PEP_ID=MMETSP0151_2-20130828/84099_1 /ASSEMBLY_ACC=CAM_ASM_000257 /TAXON_ID=200890 /ORGANISM="Paramoeba atlantica, Strain 621/1 / CCAP 1560/9" /LENGTH=363 /DNA_ID=CAMNT_0047895969 /DNA_START=478 /DNA_END=1570 /DNA_ORIENTATION=+